MDAKGRAVSCVASGHSALLFSFQALLIIPIPTSDLKISSMLSLSSGRSTSVNHTAEKTSKARLALHSARFLLLLYPLNLR